MQKEQKKGTPFLPGWVGGEAPARGRFPVQQGLKVVDLRQEEKGNTYYCNFANSALACFRMGMSGSASFQSGRKSDKAAFHPVEDLFLAQKIEVSLPTGASIHNGGKVFRKIIRRACVALPKRKRKLEGNLRRPGQLSVMPGLAVQGGLTVRSSQVQDELTVGRKMHDQCAELGQQRDAFALSQ